MAIERGEYRSTHVVVIYGKDFQQLSPAAKLSWWTLRHMCGSIGLAVISALANQLAELTGHDEPTVAAALDELEHRGWIVREANLVWIVRALEFEPQLDVSDAKHRKGVQRRVAALPNLSIVTRFRARYAPWFADEREGLPSPSQGAPKAPGSTEQVQMTEQLPEHEQEPDNRQPRARAAGGSGLTYAQRCTIAANQGLRANSAIGERFNELATSAQSAPSDWEAAGVPIEIAERVIGERARAYRPTARNLQPRSLMYFTRAVLEAWEDERERASKPHTPKLRRISA